MLRQYSFYVYIMTNSSRRSLYTGMGSSLKVRVFQHKHHVFEGFSDKYNCTRLVYWESWDDVHKAIGREKQIKRWRRGKKVALIRAFNPQWKDLSDGWYDEPQGPSTTPRALGSARDDIQKLIPISRNRASNKSSQ